MAKPKIARLVSGIDPEREYGLKEAAAIFDVDYVTMWKRVKAGSIKGYQKPHKLATRWVIPGSAIIAYRERQAVSV